MQMNPESGGIGANKDGEAGADLNVDNAVVEGLLNPVATSVAILEAIMAFFFNIIRMSCVPAELVFRRNFGERHFNLYLYFGGALWFWIWASGFISLPISLIGAPSVANTTVFTIVGVIFFGAMTWHLLIRKWFPIKQDFYSRYDGDVLPFLYWLPFSKDKQGNPKEYLIRQIYEPLFMVLLGVIIGYTVNPQTGAWITFSAIGMALKEYVRSQAVRNIMLDQIDAQLVGKYMGDAVKGKSPKETQGVYIAGMPNEGKLKEKFTQAITEKKTGKPRFSVGDIAESQAQT